MKYKLRPTGGVRRLFVVVASLVLVWLMVQNTAVSFAAYAMPTQSSPAAGDVIRSSPRRVVITFSEALEHIGSEIQVFDPDGRRVDLQNCGIDVSDPWGTTMVVNLRSDLAMGPYTVRWTTIAAESGELLSGQYQFTIAPSIWQYVMFVGAAVVGLITVTGGWVGFGVTYRRLRRLEQAYQELLESH